MLLHSYPVALTAAPCPRSSSRCPHTNHSTKDMPFLFPSLSLSTCHFLSYSPLPVKESHKCRFLFFFFFLPSKFPSTLSHTTANNARGGGRAQRHHRGNHCGQPYPCHLCIQGSCRTETLAAWCTVHNHEHGRQSKGDWFASFVLTVQSRQCFWACKPEGAEGLPPPWSARRGRDQELVGRRGKPCINLQLSESKVPEFS